MSNLIKKDFRMPAEVAKGVEQTAAEMGISQSELIRRVLDLMIARDRLGLPITPARPARDSA